MFYSQSTGGFYNREIHGENIPVDAVEITKEAYSELLFGQSNGKIISANSAGRPVLIYPPEPTHEEMLARLDSQRKAAYMAESDPIGWRMLRDEATKQEWLDKITEIKQRHPKP